MFRIIKLSVRVTKDKNKGGYFIQIKQMMMPNIDNQKNEKYITNPMMLKREATSK